MSCSHQLVHFNELGRGSWQMLSGLISFSIYFHFKELDSCEDSGTLSLMGEWLDGGSAVKDEPPLLTRTTGAAGSKPPVWHWAFRQKDVLTFQGQKRE